MIAEARSCAAPVARVIVSLKRDESVEQAWAAARNAVALRPWVVALDFCGVDTRAAPFSSAFAEVVSFAQGTGLPFVTHFAEAAGETDLQALLDAKPVRLGHAVWMDDAARARVLHERVPIECCLASNLNTMRRDGHLPAHIDGGLVQAVREHHPVAEWHRVGHPFALCCDNIGLLGMPLSETYYLVAQALAGDQGPAAAAALAWRMARASIDASCAPPAIKEMLMAQLDAHPFRPSSSS